MKECKKCKYYKIREGSLLYYDVCIYGLKPHQTELSKNQRPSNRNRNNDCKDFKLKWWRGLFE